tara:strand:+ start:116 stop:520 length:405 start_codon:yes stop_codon:yes gene_type:complete
MDTTFNISINKSDSLGVISSGLCMIHCLATPFFFVAAACSKSCCAAAPSWWLYIDYIFLIISFVAVMHSTKDSTYNFVKFGLWLSWLGLFAFIINISYSFIDISDNVKFIPGFSLIGFHLYNARFCNCTDKECC